MHSLTKYMNGHSDVIMGAAMTNDDDVHTRLRFLQNGKFGDYSFYLKKKTLLMFGCRCLKFMTVISYWTCSVAFRLFLGQPQFENFAPSNAGAHEKRPRRCSLPGKPSLR